MMRLFYVLALMGVLLRGMAPMGAQAASGDGGWTVIVCTAEGQKTLRIGPDGQPVEDMPRPSDSGCPHMLCPRRKEL